MAGRLLRIMSSSTRRIAVLHNQLTAAAAGVQPRATAGFSSDAAASVLSTRTQIDVLDSYMSYLDTGHVAGTDNTVIFLHGNPTQAYLWRNIIPHVKPFARCIAPDLIGCGHSGKLSDHDYRIKVHYEYLCALLDKLNLPHKVTFVIHDWGSALGFHWCNMHRERVKGIAFMEAVVAPVPSWDRFPENARQVFQALRTEQGEDMVLKNNFFVETLLPVAIMRQLTDEEMEQYVVPFKNEGEDRRPTLTFPREIPVGGQPPDVNEMVTNYNRWCREDGAVPKLYVHAEPGFFSAGIRRSVSSWPNVRRVKAKGLHFLQEDDPDTIGTHVAQFVQDISTPAADVLRTRKRIDVLDSYMSYLDTGNVPGSDETVIFLHGNPTQAYLWRNIIPHVKPFARCIAPDLIGCGHSGKLLDHDYRIKVHYEYLCALLDKLNLPNKVTFVIHDWGSALGFHWCNMHKDRVKGIVFMESIVDTVPWDIFPEVGRKAFQNMRSEAGEEMVLKKNFFVQRLLPLSVLGGISDYDMEQYIFPFRNEGEDRRPTLTFPREIPIEGHPKDVHDMVKSYNAWLREDMTIRKLHIDAEPGFFSPFIRQAVADWPNLTQTKAKGLHFLQEDSPDVIGQAVAKFIQSA